MKALTDTVTDDEGKVKHVYIESDDTQFTVRVYSDKLDKNQKPIQISSNYFSTLQGACRYALQNMIVKKTTASDLQGLIDCMDGIEQRMVDMVGRLSEEGISQE